MHRKRDERNVEHHKETKNNVIFLCHRENIIIIRATEKPSGPVSGRNYYNTRCLCLRIHLSFLLNVVKADVFTINVSS